MTAVPADATIADQPFVDRGSHIADEIALDVHENSTVLGAHKLKRRAIQGTICIIAGYGTGQAMRFGSNVILTRMLFPEAFGLMALVAAVLQGLTMFSDVGIGPAIIRHPRGHEPDFYNTAWTIQIFRGFALWLAGCALAVPIARFYGQPQLAGLIPFAAFAAVISGFNSTKLFSANRKLRLGRIILIDLGSQIVGIVVMIGAAWHWQSVWALAFGGLAIAAIKRTLYHVILPGVGNRLCWDQKSVRELYSFGRWIFVSTLFTFLAMQTDKLMLGRLVSLDVLGVYSIAFALVAAISGIFSELSQKIVMPSIASVSRTAADQLPAIYRRSHRLLLGAAAIAVINLILLSPTFFRLLYTELYSDAGWMAQCLAIGLWFNLLQRLSQAGLVSLGSSGPLAAANATNCAVTVVAAPIGYWFFGVAGFIGGWGLGNLAAAVVQEVALARRGLDTRRDAVTVTLRITVLATLGIILQHYMISEAIWCPQWLAETFPALLVSIVAGREIYVEAVRIRSSGKRYAQVGSSVL